MLLSIFNILVSIFCCQRSTKKVIELVTDTVQYAYCICIDLSKGLVSETNIIPIRFRDREDVRNFYETQCLYIWSPSKSEVFLEGFKSLEKVSNNNFPCYDLI